MGPRRAPVAARRDRARVRREDISRGPSRRVHEAHDRARSPEGTRTHDRQNSSPRSGQTYAGKARHDAEQPSRPTANATLRKRSYGQPTSLRQSDVMGASADPEADGESVDRPQP